MGFGRGRRKRQGPAVAGHGGRVVATLQLQIALDLVQITHTRVDGQTAHHPVHRLSGVLFQGQSAAQHGISHYKSGLKFQEARQRLDRSCCVSQAQARLPQHEQSIGVIRVYLQHLLQVQSGGVGRPDLQTHKCQVHQRRQEVWLQSQCGFVLASCVVESSGVQRQVSCRHVGLCVRTGHHQWRSDHGHLGSSTRRGVARASQDACDPAAQATWFGLTHRTSPFATPRAAQLPTSGRFTAGASANR